MTIERLRSFIPQLMSKMHIECLIHGNCTKTHAVELGKLVDERFCGSSTGPLLSKQLLLSREHKLENGTEYLFEISNDYHKSSCLQIYFECGVQSTESNMLLELLCQVLNEPCFNVLRTQEQLGYIVFLGTRRSNGVQGLRIIVQSSKHPSYVDLRVEDFLKTMRTLLDSLTTEEFDRHKEALASQLLIKPKRLSALASRYWSEIMTQQYHFNRQDVEAAHLKTITKDELLQFFMNVVEGGSAQRKKLAVYITSAVDDSLEAGPDGELEVIHQNYSRITDITTFKSSKELFPLKMPYIDIPRKGAKSKL